MATACEEYTRTRERAVPYWTQVLGLCLLSFALMMWGLDARGIWWDESLSLYRAQNDVRTILGGAIEFPGIHTIDQHPPLYFVILHGVINVLGDNDFFLRLPSAIAATLMVPISFCLGARLRSQYVGLVAAAFASLSPLLIWYGQEARMYALVAVLASLAAYFLWRARDEHSARWAVAGVATCAAGMATHYLFVLSLPCFALLTALPAHGASGEVTPSRARQKRMRLWLALGAGTVVAAAAIAATQARPHLSHLEGARDYVPLGTMLVDVLNSFSLGLSVNLRQVWPLDVLFALVFLLGMWSLLPARGAPFHRPAPWRHLSLLVGLTLFPVFAIWGLSYLSPIYTGSRYSILGSGAFYLGLGLGVDALAQCHGHGSRKYVAGVGTTARSMVLAVLAGSMLYSVGRYQFSEYYRSKERYRAVAQLIAENTRVGDVILVSGPESVPALTHYYTGPLSVFGAPDGRWEGDAFHHELQEIATSADRLWFVRGRTQISDPNETVRRWVDENTLGLMHRGYSSSGAYLAIESRLPADPIMPTGPDSPVWGTWDGKLTLASCTVRYWSADRQPVEMMAKLSPAYSEGASHSPGDVSPRSSVPAGSVVSAAIYAQPLTTLPRLKVSLRLERDDMVWSQRDREPYMFLPSSEWPTGSTVRWETDVSVPPDAPPGDYVLRLVVYDADTATPLTYRQAGRDDEAAPILGHIGVTWPQRHIAKDELLPTGATFMRIPATFGRSQQLRAANVSPRMAEPGKHVWLDLHWVSRSASPPAHHIAVNWQAQDGSIWHRSDAGRLLQLVAAEDWRPGQLVRQTIKLSIPEDAPPGLHRLHLLLYDPQYGRFATVSRGILPWTGSDLLVGTVEILH